MEPYEGKVYVVQNPPAKPLTQDEMDDVYALPYMRSYHPSYEAAGGVPAIREIKFSLISNRGCLCMQLLRTDFPSGKDHPGKKP